jgi:hypothetical protein
MRPLLKVLLSRVMVPSCGELNRAESLAEIAQDASENVANSRRQCP